MTTQPTSASRWLVRLTVAFVFGIATIATSQAPRVLVAGDSWGYGSAEMNSVFAEWGHGDKGIRAINLGGLKARDLALPVPATGSNHCSLSDITFSLTSMPSIEFVHLIIGVNDFDNFVFGSGAAYEAAYVDGILSDIETIVQHCLSIRPDVQVVLPSYDFPNFEANWQGVAQSTCNSLSSLFGNPTTSEMNELVTRFEAAKERFSSDIPRVHYLPLLGLWQQSNGVSGVPAWDPSLPDTTLPSPASMMNDCFHPNALGHRARFHEGLRLFYDDYFNAQYPFRGSEEDFEMTTHSTNGAGAAEDFFKLIEAEATLTVEVNSPNGFLTGGTPLLMFRPFDAQNQPTPSVAHPFLYLDPALVGTLYNGITLLTQLNRDDIQLARTVIPVSARGTQWMFQSALLTPLAANGMFVTSALHVISIY